MSNQTPMHNNFVNMEILYIDGSFGLGDQFQINEGHARAKLLVGK